MKTKSLLLGLIFVVAGFASRAQVYQMYHQGFETDESVNYAVTPASGITYTTDLKVGGDRAMKMVQSSTEDIVFVTDTIDFRQNTTLRYVALEFDHINNVTTNTGAGPNIGLIYVKRANQSDNDYVQLDGTHYAGGVFSPFGQTATFNKNSYTEWGQSVMTNDYWKHERFNINTMLGGSVPTSERRLIFKFVLKRKLSGNATGTGWWIDNINIRSSQDQIISPTITMITYPDGGNHPSSRGARVELTASTTLTQGINPDSVYLIYKAGSDPTEHRLYMTPRTETSPVYQTRQIFSTRIPFEGYDTLMQFYCVVKDATSNANEATFPTSSGSWVQYRCVRGSGRNYLPLPDNMMPTAGSTFTPFPNFADNRAEFVYDSALLANAGYGPGAITDVRFLLHGNTSTSQRPKFQLRMKNVNTNYTVLEGLVEPPFTTDYMQVVFDSTLFIAEGAAGAERHIHLKDTFFYAGKDIVVQTIYDASTDPAAANVGMIPTAAGKKTVFFYGLDAEFNTSAYTNDDMGDHGTDYLSQRPSLFFTEHANVPLLYDMGVSALVDPNYTTPITSVPAQISVQLKNFGALNVNAVRISYTIDDTIFGHYDWSGNMAPSASATVVVATGVTLPAGYHYLRAWVEDTLTAAGVQYRDHEPMNDTSYSPFIVCDGPLSGVRNIGGDNADYNDIEEFLFSLSRCGLGDSLIVKLAPGDYPPFSMPSVSGLSAEHYLVFCPQDSGRVTLYSDNTTGADAIVNLTEVSNIRFRGINFVRRSGALTNMVVLGMTSHNCHFERCTFVDSMSNVAASMRIGSMLSMGFSNGLYVEGCTFEGGTVGLDLSGQANDMHSSGVKVFNNYFHLQNTNAIKMQFLSNSVVKHNELYDVTDNSSYVLLAYSCHQIDILANKVYTSHGAGAIGISNVTGTYARRAIIANNMVVCNDDGTANLLTTPFNVIQGSWIDAVYNSVKLTAPERNNIPAATFGGGILSSSRFVNNIVSCFDDVNYAFNYIPGSNGSTNEVGHNVYYSEGYTLNRRTPGGNYANLAAWLVAMPSDSASISINPGFINGELVDLRTFNRLIKGVGTPIDSVTTDMFDTVRNATAPCPGAFEFVSLFYDFEPEALASPEADNCDMPDNVELMVRLRNSGVTAYTPGGGVPLSIGYRIDGGTPHTVAVNTAIPGEDTVTIHTGQMLAFTPGNLVDITHTLEVWTIYANDPNQTNDTNVFEVIQRFHETAPSNYTASVPYATSATLIPTAGFRTWPEYFGTAGSQGVRGRVLWYASTGDNEPFYIGDTLVTDTLRQDTVFYFQQRRLLPMVRITQVQMKGNNSEGLTNPMPTWMATGTKLAVQLTNVGDDTAYLAGDTLRTVSPTSNINNKYIRFGDIRLAPGQSLVVQYVNSATSNYHTIHTGTTISPAVTANIGLVYKHGNKVVDAVPFNSVITTTSTQAVKWSTQNVPAAVWSGDAVMISAATVGGVIRTGFSGTATDWVEATTASPMFLDTINQEWIRYADNGCPGDFAQATVSMIAPPTADVSLSPMELAEGCDLGMEEVKVRVRNYGTQPVNSLTLNYSAGGATVTETLTSPLAAGGDTVYTFLQLLNMATPVDSTFTVTIWASAVSGDTYNVNDTAVVSAVALFTPAAPVVPSTSTINYATADTITLNPGAGLVPVWYDAVLNPIDTANTHITDVLYADELIGVAYLVADSAGGQIGTSTSTNAKQAYPSPYQPNNKFVKQQYIYTASELNNIGLHAGTITDISFFLDSIWGTVDSLLYSNYYISMGLTTDTIYSGTSAWKNTEVVYSRVPYVLRRSSSKKWVNHRLDTPFEWDGTSSIAVQIAYERSDAYTTGLQTRYTTKTNTTLYKAANSALAANTATIDFVGAGTRGNNRPNIMFNSVTFGCTGDMSMMNIHLIGVPDADAKLYWPDGTDSIIYDNCANVSMNVNVRNLGLSILNGFTLRYQVDDMVEDSVIVTTTLVGGAIAQPQLFSMPLDPGRHTVTAIVEADGDNIHSNDTVRRDFVVRFCGGTYTISATDSTADFSTVGEAVDSLSVVGIVGPVVFEIGAGTYNEQVELQPIAGSSATNTVTFRGESDSTVLITYLTTNTANYVISLNGVSNVILDNLSLRAEPAATTGTTGNYANVVSIANGGNITISNSTIRVKGTINNANASCVVLQSKVDGLTMLNNVVDSGYYSVKSVDTVDAYKNLVFQGNQFTGFWFGGLELKNVVNLDISSNRIQSGVTVANRGLTGIKLTAVDSVIMIQKNHIYLVDDKTGGKQGIRLERVKGFNQVRAYIMNNMISCYGTGNAGGISNPSGIYIDKGCSYINIYYNSIRVYAGATQVNSRGIHIGGNNITNITNIQVLNNIFANYSNSFAYYVSGTGMVNVSDYNAYFTLGQKLAYWGGDCLTLPDLQTANSRDANSLYEEPYFVSENDLHLIMTNFVSKAQYNTDVTEDIDNNIRPQIPAPTIGAHEMERLSHNMSVVRILAPVMPANINNPNNIESDSILVKVEFYNNGSATETNVMWYAYLEGYESQSTSVMRNLGTFISSQKKVDSVMVPTFLGVIDTQSIRVVLITGVDDDTTDNQMTTPVYLGPAYDLQAQKVQTSATGCDLYNTQVSITLKNVGFKDFPAGVPIQIGFHAQGYHPNYQANNPNNNRLNIRTMPDTVIEVHSLASILPSGQPITIVFDSIVNLYPTDTVLNIKVRLNGWCRYQYDVTLTNDSTGAAASASPVIDSYYTPVSPVGRDTTLAYGTWGEVTATQANNRPIRWFRDTTATHFYTGNNYAASCKWSTTPQYFHDSTYYLMCTSDKGCSSFFSPVTVHVANQLPVDAAIETVLAPLGGRVYSENDTVRVRIANYGTQSLANIPITFALRRGNNTNPLQMVTEVCTTSIAPNQTYVYTFDTLLSFANPLQGNNYQLRVWTDLENDGERRNDTIRWQQQLRPAANNNTILDYPFNTLPESTYPAGVAGSSTVFDFTQISFNEIDIDLPPLGRAYTNFGAFTNPEWPVLHVTRGMQDSIILVIADPTDPSNRDRGKVAVYIDFNRNGSFSDVGEAVLPSTQLFTNYRFASLITIPNKASYGYMKMRVVVSTYDNEPTPTITGEQGQMVDFLLFVNAQAPISDIAFTQIVSPRDYLIRDDSPVAVSFRMSNKGRQTINSFTVNYSFVGDTVDSTAAGSFLWTGNLAPGRSTIVTLPEHNFPVGTSELRIWPTLGSDANHDNDTIVYEYHRFHVVVLAMHDNFDSLNHWYAPTGYNEYTRNYWQCGIPNKTRIAMAYSEPNAWVTDTTYVVTPGRRGNISYLYSPIINIAQIRPDTISFRLQRNLINGSSLTLEFYNYERNWQKVDEDTIIAWYNNADDHVFDATSTGNAYNRYWISTSGFSGDFNEKLQFRFVYRAPQGSSDNASFGEGCSIDDFSIGRARRRIDVGVVEITKPEFPKYGQTIYPEVVVKNFGLDTARRVEVGYVHYGAALEKISVFNCIIPPGEYDTLVMTAPFIVTSDFPDTFNIQAFTINSADLYRDNDTTEKAFTLAPLDNDISAEAILQPLNRVIAGDSVTVTMRIRNFGMSEISNARLSYIFNGYLRVDEDVDIEAILGRPLRSMEYFNYTFNQRFRASMGSMGLSCIAKNDANEYIYNDTVFKRFDGISAITDVAAAAVVVDTSSFNDVKVQLIIENRGARGANNFEVGFWYDNDTSTRFSEYYQHEEPLEALSTGYHLFSIALPTRHAAWDHFVGFVHIEDDNDPSNDTTTLISRQYIDVEVMGLIIEENAQPDCRVFIQLRNIGNLTLTGKALQLRATVNGNDLHDNVVHTLEPGRTVTLEFSRRIPKDRMRRYEGDARLVGLGSDIDQSNNQSTNITVVNYYEDVPTVNGGSLVLDQNYPNPFSGTTVVPFSLPDAANVRFFVMDAMGKMVNSFESFFPAGDNTVEVDMQRFAAGVYYYGIEVDGQRQMRKMILR